MADVEREIQLTLTAKDLASAAVKQVAKAASNLSDSFDSITHKLVGIAAPIASVFGMGASIHGAKEYLRTIEELKTITNQTANSTAGIVHAMEQSGLRGEETRAIMISMSRKQAELVGGSQEMAKMAKKYGVELKKGPEEALVSMAEQMEKGKIGTGEVVKLLEESGAKAVDLLRKGPAEVQRLLREGEEKNAHINDNTIKQYKQMDIQMTRVKQAWTRITTAVLIKIMPTLTKGMAIVEQKIDSISKGATKFGNYLVENMDKIVKSAILYGKIMAANYAMMKMPGSGGKGIMHQAGRVGGFLAGGARGAGVAGKIPGIGPILDKFIKGVPFIGKIAGVLLRLGPIGIVVTAIVAGIAAIMKNVDGVRTRIMKLLGKTWENIKGIGKEIMKLFSEDSALGKGVRWLGDKVATVFEFIAWGIERITAVAKKFIRFVSLIIDDPAMITHAGKMWEIAGNQLAREALGDKTRSDKLAKRDAEILKATRQLQALEAKKKLTVSDRAAYDEATGILKKYGIKTARGGLTDRIGGRLDKLKNPNVVNYQDFRGSRFDILQQFAEGFDPERIAATFGNDIANLGERRLQSGLAPAFSVR